MIPEQRYKSQIRNLCETAHIIHAAFSHKKPVDKTLSAHFREHKKFGSKDRRFISSAIFGFYRWYGWLAPLLPDNFEKALILGYILDNNPISDIIRFWCKDISLKISLPNQEQVFSGSGLEERRQFVCLELPEITLKDLNPDFTGPIKPETREAFQKRPATWLRATRQATEKLRNFLKKQELEFSQHTLFPEAFAIRSPFNIHSIPLFKSGDLEIQDITSQAVGKICSPKQSDIWWDVCSGAGGKALHLADLMLDKGNIFATEVRKHAFNELEKRVKKGNWSSIKPILWDGLSQPDFRYLPTHVLVDAPCSCSGTWRRSPDVRWSITEDDVKKFSSLQLEILNRIAKMDLPIQTIFYATCSILKEENEVVVEQFLKKNPEYTTSPIFNPYTNENCKKGLHLLPPDSDGIGMFIAKLVKQ